MGGQTVISLDSRSAEERYGSEPTDPMTLEQVYERRWALTLLETVLARLASWSVGWTKARWLRASLPYRLLPSRIP